MPPLPPPRPSRRGRRLVIGAVVTVLAVAAVVLAVVVLGGDETETTSTTPDGTPVTTAVGGVDAGERQPVTVIGEPLPQLPQSGDDQVLGLAAPTIEGYGFDGAPIVVEPGGRPKLLVFLVHGSPECEREIAVIREWAAAGPLPDDLEIIGITTGTNPNQPGYPPSQWLAGLQWEWPVLADSDGDDAGTAYGLTGHPYFVVVGDDGTVKVRFSGEIGVDRLAALVGTALN